jgi:hypothetical protein
MLFGEFDCELGDDVLGVSLEGGVEGAVTVDHDEAEGRLVDEQFLLEVVEVEAGLAAVDREVDGLEGLEVADKFFLSGGVLVHDASCEDYESVVRRPLVEFEPFPSRDLRLDHGLAIGLVLDLGGLALFVVQQFGYFRNVLLGRHDDGDHAAVDFGRLEAVEEFLQSEDLDGIVDLHVVEMFIT